MGEDGGVVLFASRWIARAVFVVVARGFSTIAAIVQRGRPADSGEVARGGGVDEDGLRVGAREHGRFGGEEDVGGEMGAVDVALAEGGVGFGDADEGDLRVLEGRLCRKPRTWP